MEQEVINDTVQDLTYSSFPFKTKAIYASGGLNYTTSDNPSVPDMKIITLKNPNPWDSDYISEFSYHGEGVGEVHSATVKIRGSARVIQPSNGSASVTVEDIDVAIGGKVRVNVTYYRQTQIYSHFYVEASLARDESDGHQNDTDVVVGITADDKLGWALGDLYFSGPWKDANGVVVIGAYTPTTVNEGRMSHRNVIAFGAAQAAKDVITAISPESQALLSLLNGSKRGSTPFANFLNMVDDLTGLNTQKLTDKLKEGQFASAFQVLVADIPKVKALVSTIAQTVSFFL